MAKKERLLGTLLLGVLFLSFLRPSVALYGSSTVENISRMAPIGWLLTISGVPGETLPATLDRLKSDPELCRYKVIAVASGINDARSGSNPQEMLKTVALFKVSTESRCGKNSPRIGVFELWSPKTSDCNTSEAVATIREFNEGLGATGVTVLKADVGGYETDGLHPDYFSRWRMVKEVLRVSILQNSQ